MRIGMILTDTGQEVTDRLFVPHKRPATGTPAVRQALRRARHRRSPPRQTAGATASTAASRRFCTATTSGEDLETLLHRDVRLPGWDTGT